MHIRKVLLVGSGAREHAILLAILAWYQDIVLYCAPGNAGMGKKVVCVPIDVTNIKELRDFAVKEGVDLTIVGPEMPLILGIVDLFEAAGLLVCGPSAAAARAEGSKVWFKNFLLRHELPTSPFRSFSDREAALVYVRKRGPKNIVLKADRPRAGKGVRLPKTMREVAFEIDELMSHSSGQELVIEDFVVGLELSAIAIVDEKTLYDFPFTLDYKRRYDGNKGPNTGGMGAHTINLPPALAERVRALMWRVLCALRDEGCAYRGIIYLGLMLTKGGIKILECNCRGGDPETQVILASLYGHTDFLALCYGAATGTLGAMHPPVKVREAACVVLVPPSYPEPSETDIVIEGLDLPVPLCSTILHAGTHRDKDGALVAGRDGRTLCAVGTGPTREDACMRAYQAASNIRNLDYRKDVGVGEFEYSV